MEDDARIAFITGANRGIGRAAAHGLATAGLTVVIGSRRLEHGRAVATDIVRAGGEAMALTVDVRDQRSIADATQEIDDRFGRLDVLVNNAGISGEVDAQTPGSADLDAVRDVFETNLFAVIAVTESMLPLLRRSPAGRIVNVSSGTSSMGWTSDATHYMSRSPGLLAYPTSKTALNMLTMQYAKSLAGDGIMVNAVAPGACDTDFTAGIPGAITRTADEGAAVVARLATLGRESPTGGFFDDDGSVPW
ncbi:dehydrogenase [Brachybacterium endophyticum]|uniref:Dehydrogenase n=1 Tax=Brachybacterium endophyticum TaxID=2182385 RepID=A0A2U2RGQ4_9MICO|nr:SDR family NAD(P)-dependent oxidoreductase [Brachybacterium endophyticum]PWH05049.1 dehydrogenase [Brachybacterium endophyticum]